MLLSKGKAQALKEGQKFETKPEPVTEPVTEPVSEPEPPTATQVAPGEETSVIKLLLKGAIPPEIWNRLVTKILPKLRSGKDLKIGIEFGAEFSAKIAHSIEAEIRQIPQDLGIADKVSIEEDEHIEPQL